MSDYVTNSVPPLVPGDASFFNVDITNSIRAFGISNSTSEPLMAPQVIVGGPNTLLGFWLPTNANLIEGQRVAIAQPTGTISTTGVAESYPTGGTAVTNLTTYGTGANVYTIPQIVEALRSLGLLA